VTGPNDSGGSWRDRLAAVRAGRTASAAEPSFDPSSWTGALIVMVGATAVLWVVQIVNSAQHYSLDRFGLRPRRVDGLWGILTQTFLHDSWGHLVYNSVSFAILGWVVLLAGLRIWLIVSAVVLVLGGLLAWLVAPSGVLVGASALSFGWLGYLLARAYFSRKIRWILTAVAVLVFFGGLLGGLLPGNGTGSISWPDHLCGFGAGVLAGAVLHPRRAAAGRPEPMRRTPPVS
jgi:membrane associated rhomboid family serine protease